MSQTTKVTFLLSACSVPRNLEAVVVAARFSHDGRMVAVALGDGTVWLTRAGSPAKWTSVTVHDGAVLDFAPDPTGDGFISGGDDGRLRRIGGDGSVSDIGTFGVKWVEHVATFRPAKGRGLIAASAGK